MSRRRYVSTAISTDTRVKRLMAERGPLAALLYTWMIPHAEDDGTLPADPEELQMIVIPGTQRSLDAEEVGSMIDAMVDLGLIVRDDNHLRFPDSFYKYQRYITETRRQRKSAQPASLMEEPAQISADPRESAQNSASSSSSFSSPVSFSVSSPVKNGDDAPDGAAPPPAPLKRPPRKSEITDEFTETVVQEYAPHLGGELRTRQIVSEALAHKNRNKWDDKQAYLKGWLRREVEHYQPSEQRNGRANGTGQHRRDDPAAAPGPFAKYTSKAADAERQRRAHSPVPG